MDVPEDREMARQRSPQKTITIFGSGSPRLKVADYELARRLGAELAGHGFRVCNGGYGGTMKAAAQGAREHGGSALGVTLTGSGQAAPNEWLEQVLPQPDLPSRILRLLEHGEGFVVLGGGTGTLAEIGILLEFQSKGLMPRSPIVFLGQFWQPLLGLLAGEKILRRESPFTPVEGIEMLGSIACTDSPEAAAQYLAANLSGSDSP